MPDKWMTVAEAAASIKVHPRTIERRIAGGKIQTRRADDGMLQVLITLPDMSDKPSETALETVRELAADQVTLATGSASALVKFAQDDALRSRDEIMLVRQDAGRARRSALAAWCVVAAMGIGVCIAVGWTAQTIARTNQDVKHLNDYASQMKMETAKLSEQYETARQEAVAAQLARAEATGKLAAYEEQAARHPTTRPANFIQKLAAAFAEP